MQKRVKIAITGAAGQIGYSLLFPLASGYVFGENTEVELQLIELESALPRLEGVVMELNDAAFPLLKKISITSHLDQGMNNANWVLLVGSVPRKAGMERSDLLKINGGIFTAQGQAISNNAADDVRVLVVGNPCNTNALIAMNNAPNIPNDRFFAMTMLDEQRAKYQLAQKAGVDVTAVNNMIIWGNHSATQYPDFYNAKINAQPAAKVITDENWLKTDFIKTVQQRGAAIINARGASSAASAAYSAMHTIKSLINDTAPHDAFSVCSVSNGQYGVDEGLIFSFPTRVDHGKVSVLEDYELNTFGQEKFTATLNELKEERDAVKALGLIQ